MGINAARGDVALSVDGVDRKLCLTLGALAEMEAALGCETIAELEIRMRTLSAVDIMIVLAALLRGGGELDTAAQIAKAVIAPGEAARAVAEAFQLALGG